MKGFWKIWQADVCNPLQALQIHGPGQAAVFGPISSSAQSTRQAPHLGLNSKGNGFGTP